MMVTVENGDTALLPILQILQDKTAKVEDKVDSWIAFCKQLKEDDNAAFVDGLQSNITNVMTLLLQGIEGDNAELSRVSVDVLGQVFMEKEVMGCISPDEQKKLLKSLCNLVLKTTDKNCCSHALWCLSKETILKEVLDEECHTLLCTVEHAFVSRNFQSVSIEHEGINILARMLEVIPTKMKPHTARWAKLVYPLLVHNAPKVREKAIVIMENHMETVMEHQAEIVKTLVPDLRALLISEMKRLQSSKQELVALKVWCIYVRMLGKVLHHGSLINELLPIVEKGFKDASIETKMAAYKAWRGLIDNFALNPDIVSHQKRVKLIMEVFKLNNAKTERIAVEKMQVWWHFVLQLGPKISDYFDMVCIPLLNFVIGGSRGSVTGTPSRHPGTPSAGINSKLPRTGGYGTPPTPHMSLGASAGSQVAFKSVQMKGCEILAAILGLPLDEPSLPKVKFTLALPSVGIIKGSSFFLKHAQVFVIAAREAFLSLGGDLGEGLIYHIWYSLIALFKNAIDSTNKKDNVDAVIFFLSNVQQIVNSQVFEPRITLKLLQAVICLPTKMLSSASYAVGGSEIMQGCPSLFLIEQLFHHRILESCMGQELFFTVFEKLVLCGLSNTTGVLEYCQSVLQLIERNAVKVENKESLWRLWSIIVNPLMAEAVKSNEVNQGDALEHDFSCFVLALSLPLDKILCSDLTQGTVKTLLKTWDELYGIFARLSAMVTCAPGNACCEELCEQLIKRTTEVHLKELIFVDTLIQACLTIVNHIDFSSFTNQSTFNLASPMSPTKFSKRKQKTLGNLHSFVRLTALLTESLYELSHKSCDIFSTTDRKIASGAAYQLPAGHVIQTLTTLFTHVPISSMIIGMIEKLAKPLSKLFDGSSKKTMNKMFSIQIGQKLEQLWMYICTALQSKYSGSYDSDVLEKLSPLFETNFLHSKRGISKQTAMMWNATFAKANMLSYPSELKPVLAKVKEKTPMMVLPGWDAVEITVVEETPFSQSQFSQQGESQVPVAAVVAMTSPRKAVGSFMNKAVSPNVKSSPLKPSRSPRRSPGPVRKKLLNLDQMRNDEFVVIPQEKKKRVLTEHQRETMKEKRDIPALYSVLDQSMDASLSSQFVTDSQMSVASQNTQQIDLKAPFSFLSKKTDKDNQDTDLGTTNSNKDKGKTEEPKDTFVKPTDIPVESVKTRRRSVRFIDEKSESMETESSEAENLQGARVKNNDNSNEENVVLETEEVQAESMDIDMNDGQEISFVNESGIIIEDSVPNEASQQEKVAELDKETTSKPREELEKENKDQQEEDDVVISSQPKRKRGRPKKKNSQESLDLGKKEAVEQDVEMNAEGEDNEVPPTIPFSSSAYKADDATITSEKEESDKHENNESQSQVEAEDEMNSSQTKRKRGRPRKSSQDSHSSQDSSSSQSRITRKRIESKSPCKSPRKAPPNNERIDKWVKVTPKKNKPEKDVLVQDTEMDSQQGNGVVCKIDPEDAVADTPAVDQESQRATKIEKLFEDPGADKENASEDVMKIETSPSLSQVSISSIKEPVVQLQRLTDLEILSYSPKSSKRHKEKRAKENEDSSQEKSVTKTRQKRQRSSMFKLSKSNTEDDDFSDIRSLNSDEIIPSSQDSNGFDIKSSREIQSSGKTKDSELAVPLSTNVSDMPADTPLVDNTGVKDGDVESKENTTAVGGTTNDISETKINESDKLLDDSALNTSISDKGNPDIVPIDISMKSDDPQATIITTPRPRRPPRRFIDESEDSEKSQKRSSRKGKTKQKELDSSAMESDSSQSSVSVSQMTENEIGNSESEEFVIADKPTMEESENKTSQESQSQNLLSKGKKKGRGRKSLSNNNDIEAEKQTAEPKKANVVNLTDETSSCEIIQEINTKNIVEEDVKKENESTPSMFSNQTTQSEQRASSIKAKRRESTSKTRQLRRKKLDGVFNKVCNLDCSDDEEITECQNKKSNESMDDDVPLSNLVVNQPNAAVEEEKIDLNTSTCSEDMPLSLLSKTSGKEDMNVSTCSEDLPLAKVLEKEQKESENDKEESQQKNKDSQILSCADMFVDTPATSTPTKGKGSVPKESEYCDENIETSETSTAEESIIEVEGEVMKPLSKKRKRGSREMGRLKIDMNHEKTRVTKRLRANTKGFKRSPESPKKKIQRRNTEENESVDEIKEKDANATEQLEVSENVNEVSKVDSEVNESLNKEEDINVGDETNLEETAIEENQKVHKEDDKSDKNIKNKEMDIIPTKQQNEKDKQDSEKKIVENEKSPSLPRVMTSPKRAVKAQEPPETPTSATKSMKRGFASSRALMMVQKARMLGVQKTSPSAKNRFTMLKPSIRSSKDSPPKPGGGILKISKHLSPKSGGARGSPPPSKWGQTMTESPPSSFRPVRLPTLYSPSASPSAGILKKRKLSGDIAMDSPSPPNKQRRVSFADPIEESDVSSANSSPAGSPRPVNRCLDMPKQQGTHTPSPLVTTTPSKVVSTLSKYLTTPTKSSECNVSLSEKDSNSFAVPNKVMKKKDLSQLTPTPSSGQSTQESQLNTLDPICPELLSCDIPVEQILPKLTSSTWVRGLGTLVRARQIKTIGNLSALTEFDVNNLPIRSPKLSTIREALSGFAKQTSKEKTPPVTDKNSSTEEFLPMADEELANSPTKNEDFDTSMEDLAETAKEMSNNNAESKKDTAINIEDNNNTEVATEEKEYTLRETAKTDKRQYNKNLLTNVGELVKEMTVEELSKLPSHQFIALHQHLNTMMANMGLALKERYQPSEASQESL